ncbi:MAG: adenylosuccinate synthase [Planctomycetota bacterium]
MNASQNGSLAPHSCVVGIQWGDEGKGKIVDVLSAESDVIVRYQGGANAGHTVKVGENEYVLHLIPSGILQEGKICVIGNGVVVDPGSLVEELEELKGHGLDREENLFVSERAHVVLPYHKKMDACREKSSRGKIGTTLRGIGPCYGDKASRMGIRMAEFIDHDRFRALLERNLKIKNREFQELYGEEPLSVDEIFDEYKQYADRLRPRVCDIAGLLHDADSNKKTLLFEGAQGALLDIDMGTYPFVTSSNTSFLGLGAGTGFSPRRVGKVLGVAKAYTTRVGEGPFPTELDNEAGEQLRALGHEFGATTGRPRRCGWLDLVALRRTIQVGDVDALVITKLDVLDEIDTLEVCTGYQRGSETLSGFPAELTEDIVPVYQSLPGWKQSVAKTRRYEDLPEATRSYLQFIADETSCPIAIVSVGKDRSEVIHLDPWLQPQGVNA